MRGRWTDLRIIGAWTPSNRRAFAMVMKGVSCKLDEEAFSRYTEAVKKQHEQMGLQT